MIDDDWGPRGDGQLCRATINCGGKAHNLHVATGYGLYWEGSEDFTLLWSAEQAAWDEVGIQTATVGLQTDEIERLEFDVEWPTVVEVALAKFRLTGEVTPTTSDFVNGDNNGERTESAPA